MYNFIKNILSPKKPAPVVIAFTTIPAWTDERAKSARTALEEAAKAPMQNIRNAAAQLQHIVNSISGSEHDPALHPKLKAVAKNSLPLYVKAMNAALVKPLSDDIEGFYADAVECVKSSLNSNRGQGRYLQAVFPDEMKAVKMAIDTMGREMNVLTAALAAYQKQKTATDAVAALYQSVLDMQEDMERSVEKEHRIAARIREITSRLEAIEQEEADIMTDAEGNRAVTGSRTLLAEKEKLRNDVNRTYATRSMTASHVFRKAEKIAAKQHHTKDVTSLKEAIELLSSHEMPDAAGMSTALNAACPVAKRMIDAGEIPLKNREEREVFSDIQQFCTTMSALCTELAANDEACRNAETVVSTHPVVMKGSSLMREKTQLISMLKKEQEIHFELTQWKEKTTEKIPVVREEIRKMIERIIGENVQFQADVQVPVRG